MLDEANVLMMLAALKPATKIITILQHDIYILCI
jgi:hypothetical protein